MSKIILPNGILITSTTLSQSQLREITSTNKHVEKDSQRLREIKCEINKVKKSLHRVDSVYPIDGAKKRRLIKHVKYLKSQAKSLRNKINKFYNK